jgi:arylsulfatase A-like enzyme
VLISVDTLAAEHLSAYGYEKLTSPRLDDFASRASLYRRAYATAPWTLPTHASLFTGKYPFEHGARTFRQPATRSPLAEHHLTLAEALQALGFRTAAFVSNNAYLTEEFQLNQGFETYVVERCDGWALNRLALDWLNEKPDEPFFLFLNYMDTHAPYNTRRLKQRPGFLEHVVGGPSGKILEELEEKILSRDPSYSSESVERVVDMYDLSIANLDEAIGALFDELTALGHFDDTLILVTGDHGEIFGEHDLIKHGRDLYEPLIRVPLIIKRAGQQSGEVVDGIIDSTDIPHMILSQLPEETAGLYLREFPNAPGNHPNISENYYDHPLFWGWKDWAKRFDRERVALLEWPYKYIHSSDGNHELYDIEQDPRETRNLLEQKSATAARLAAKLDRFRSERPSIDQPPEELLVPTPEEIENLMELGYVPRAVVNPTPVGLIEAEDLPVIAKSREFPFGLQSSSGFTGGYWSKDGHMFAYGTQQGDWIELRLPEQEPGRYALELFMTKAGDYGIVAVFVNNARLGSFDLWSDRGVVPSGALKLENVELAGHKNVLRLEIEGKNPNATSPFFLFGIDGIRIGEPAR